MTEPNTPPPIQSKQTRPLSSLTLQGPIAYAAGRIGLHLPEGGLASAAEALMDLIFSLGLAAAFRAALAQAGG